MKYLIIVISLLISNITLAEEIKDDRYVKNTDSKYIKTLEEKQKRLDELEQKLKPIMLEMAEIERDMKKAMETDLTVFKLTDNDGKNETLKTYPENVRSTFYKFTLDQ